MKKTIILSFILCFLLSSTLIPTIQGEDVDIVEAYAPIFYFEKDESCYPVDVSYHIDNSYLFQIGTIDPISQSPTKELLASYTDNSYYLDNIKGTIEDDGIILDYQTSDLGYTVYAHVFESSGLTYVQYWLFYAFNQGKLNQHEGDWEMVQVVLSNNAPIEVMYSQHHSGQTALWSQVEKQGTHMKVYVSQGSHANYLRSYSGVIGVANDIVGANGKILTSSDYTLLLLESQPWLDFGGLWGWSGETEEEFTAASLLGQTGPEGPKFREQGVMWTGNQWKSSLLPANDGIFILELLLYNFVTIFIIISVFILGFLLYRIYNRQKTTGLGPRKISILYIDGVNTKSIGNILCIAAIVLAIIALFSPWYTVSTQIAVNGYETNGMTNMLKVDGLSGLQLQIPGTSGPIPFGAVIIPFSLLIGISIVFLIIATIGVSQSKTLGKKYLFRGIRLMIPVLIIFIVVFSLSMIPFETMVDTSNTGVDVGAVIDDISSSPFGGNTRVTILESNGQIALQWGLGIGGLLLLCAGIILMIAGIFEHSANTELFTHTKQNNTKKE